MSSEQTPAAKPPKLEQYTQFHSWLGHISTIFHTAASKETKLRSVIRMEIAAQSHMQLTHGYMSSGVYGRMPQKVTADCPEIEFNRNLSLIKLTDSEIFRATETEFDGK